MINFKTCHDHATDCCLALSAELAGPQKEMLEDHKRTGAYYTAIMQNQAQFKDKVVLDVGAGSGILAIFAAQAGARKVYAVEATAVAQHARRLVQHNRVGTMELAQYFRARHLIAACAIRI